MFPCLMMNNSVYSPISYSELAPKFILTIKSCCIKLSDFYNIFLRQFCHPMFLASKIFVMLSSSFSNHIMSIVFGCSKKKMIRVTASSVITFVTNLHFLWNYSFQRLVYCSMGKNISTSRPNNAISSFSNRCLPRPTFIRITKQYFFPKSIIERKLMVSTISTNPRHIHFFLIKGAAPSGSDYLVTGNRARGDMLKQITAFQLPVTKILYHVLEREAGLHGWNLEP